MSIGDVVLAPQVQSFRERRLTSLFYVWVALLVFVSRFLIWFGVAFLLRSLSSLIQKVLS